MVRSTLRAEDLPQPGSRVAIIGLGLAGATAAKLLQQKHRVVAFESLPTPGLCHHSIADGDMSFDVPLRAVSPHYYPNLFKWYRSIGVELVPVNYQSTGSDASSFKPYFRYSNYLLGGLALSFPQLSSGTFMETINIVCNYLWFVFASIYWLRFHKAALKQCSIGDYLKKHGYSVAFMDRFFLPVMSTLLSCSYDQVLAYPADLILDFYCMRQTTFFTGWRRLRCGVRVVAAHLLDGVDCRFNAAVDHIERRQDGVYVFLVGARQPEIFDYVVVATDAPVAKKILADASIDEKLLLSGVTSFGARIVAHTDAALMPADETCWSGLNYFSMEEDPRRVRLGDAEPKQLASPRNASMTTAFMQRFGMNGCDELVGSQSTGNGHAQVFQTWNPYREPAEGHLIREAYMQRAVWDVQGRQRFDEACARGVQGSRRVWFAGSYCCSGVTLLEQACTSGLDVALDFGVSLPFAVEHTPRYSTVLLLFSLVLRVLEWAVGLILNLLLYSWCRRPRRAAAPCK